MMLESPPPRLPEYSAANDRRRNWAAAAASVARTLVIAEDV